MNEMKAVYNIRLAPLADKVQQKDSRYQVETFIYVPKLHGSNRRMAAQHKHVLRTKSEMTSSLPEPSSQKNTQKTVNPNWPVNQDLIKLKINGGNLGE